MPSTSQLTHNSQVHVLKHIFILLLSHTIMFSYRENLLRLNLKEALSQPQLSIRKQLFCMTGWNLIINPDMVVKGTREYYSLQGTSYMV